MPAYRVELDRSKGGHNLVNGADAMVVFAADATQAKEIAAAQNEADGQAWIVDGTATEVVAATDWEGWTFSGSLSSGQSASYTADDTNNTIDLIAAQLVILFNAQTGIGNAAYNSTTNVLTIAGVADNLGDQKAAFQIKPPTSVESVPSLVGTIVDEGVVGADVTVALPADAAVVPQVVARLSQTA